MILLVKSLSKVDLLMKRKKEEVENNISYDHGVDNYMHIRSIIFLFSFFILCALRHL